MAERSEEERMNLDALSVLELMLANWSNNLRDAVAELQRLRAENAKMRYALVEIRDMVNSHQLYEPMTSARRCAFVRVVDDAIGGSDG